MSMQDRAILEEKCANLREARCDIVTKYQQAQVALLVEQADYSYNEIIKKKKFDSKLEKFSQQLYSIDNVQVPRSNSKSKKRRFNT